MRELPAFLKEKIEAIRRDNRHGATYLTRAAVLSVEEAAQRGTEPETLRILAVSLANARPMMAPVFDFSNRLLFFLDRVEDPAEVVAFCQTYADETERAIAEAIDRALPLLRGIGCFLTHSASAMVRDLLLRLREEGARFEVICTESRPAREGVAWGETLCLEGIETTLIADAAMGLAVERTECVLVGADGIGSFGLVHKVGTSLLAMAAQEAGVPIYVLATSARWWPRAYPQPLEPEKPPCEIAQTACAGVMNRYFDTTPLKRIGSFVNEKGVWSAAEAEAYCRRVPLHQRLMA